MSAGSPSLQHGRQLAMAINVALLAGGVTVAVLTSGEEDWHPAGLVGTLAMFALASELLASRITAPAVLGKTLFNSSAPGSLAIVFLGPAPALAIALVGLTAAALVEKTPARDVIANFASYSAFLVTAGLLAEGAVAQWDLSLDQPAIALVVMGAFLWMEVVSCVLLAGQDALAYGHSPRELARAVWRIELTVEIPLLLLAGGTAYIYGTAGLIGLAVLAAIQVLFVYLGRMLQRSYDREAALMAQAERISELSASRSRLVGQILSAEERERRRLAEALHDDALQNLFAARQDLSLDAGRPEIERARIAIEVTLDQLRDAIFELHPAVLERVGLAAAVNAVADRAGEHGGFEVVVSISPETEGVTDLLLFTISRELLANAVAHAAATSVRVDIHGDGNSVTLEVADDGCGFAPSRLRQALEEGHIGLASTQERIEALGGTFAIETSPRSGTVVTVNLPSRLGHVAPPAGEPIR